MEFKGVIYIEQQEITDEDIYEYVPEDLAEFYEEINGIVAFQGGLHIRGCVIEPKWHSLFEAWKGDNALYRTYENMYEDDVPFAQDCMGDQYFLREEMVWMLEAETGEVHDLEIDFLDFIDEAIEDPFEFLSLHPLVQYLSEDGDMGPGELLTCTPPLCEEVPEETEYVMKSIPAQERLDWLAEYYKKNR